jgi:hypothetical protein
MLNSALLFPFFFSFLARRFSSFSTASSIARKSRIDGIADVFSGASRPASSSSASASTGTGAGGLAGPGVGSFSGSGSAASSNQPATWRYDRAFCLWLDAVICGGFFPALRHGCRPSRGPPLYSPASAKMSKSSTSASGSGVGLRGPDVEVCS